MGHRDTQTEKRLARWQLSVEQTTTDRLTAGDWAELLPFFQATYAIDQAGLEASISNRTHLVRVRERGGGRLVGTTAYGITDVTTGQGERVRVFYAGDVLLRPQLRGSGLVQELAARVVLAEMLRYPLVPHYGFGVALTHYMYLGVIRSFTDAWPRRGTEIPADIRLIMDSVGRKAYPDTWRGPSEPVAVGRRGRERELVIGESMLADPDVRYFVEHNPDYARGTALPFMVKIDAKNLASLSVRSLRKLLGR